MPRGGRTLSSWVELHLPVYELHFTSLKTYFFFPGSRFQMRVAPRSMILQDPVATKSNAARSIRFWCDISEIQKVANPAGVRAYAMAIGTYDAEDTVLNGFSVYAHCSHKDVRMWYSGTRWVIGWKDDMDKKRTTCGWQLTEGAALLCDEDAAGTWTLNTSTRVTTSATVSAVCGDEGHIGACAVTQGFVSGAHMLLTAAASFQPRVHMSKKRRTDPSTDSTASVQVETDEHLAVPSVSAYTQTAQNAIMYELMDEKGIFAQNILLQYTLDQKKQKVVAEAVPAGAGVTTGDCVVQQLFKNFQVRVQVKSLYHLLDVARTKTGVPKKQSFKCGVRIAPGNHRNLNCRAWTAGDRRRVAEYLGAKNRVMGVVDAYDKDDERDVPPEASTCTTLVSAGDHGSYAEGEVGGCQRAGPPATVAPPTTVAIISTNHTLFHGIHKIIDESIGIKNIQTGLELSLYGCTLDQVGNFNNRATLTHERLRDISRRLMNALEVWNGSNPYTSYCDVGCYAMLQQLERDMVEPSATLAFVDRVARVEATLRL